MFDFEKRLTEIGQQTILCIGDLMLDDFVYGDVSRISPEAPAPVIRVSREDVIVGGAGNVARNVASLGAKCLFVGVIGLGIDAASGAMNKYQPGVEIAMSPIPNCGAPKKGGACPWQALQCLHQKPPAKPPHRASDS